MELLDVSLMAVSERLDSEDGQIIEKLCGFPFQYKNVLIIVTTNLFLVDMVGRAE